MGLVRGAAGTRPDGGRRDRSDAGRARLRLLGGDPSDVDQADGPLLPVHRPRRADDALHRGRPRGGRWRRPGRQRRRAGDRTRQQPGLVLADRRLRAGLHDAGLDPRCRRLPDLPGPLLQRRPVERPQPGRGAGRGGRRALPLRRRVRQRRPAEGVGRPSGGLLPRLPGRLVRRRAARARLLRRRPGRDHRQARRPGGARRHGALPQPDLRRALEPPRRHEQLRRDRPGPRDPGGLRDASQGGRRPRHPGAAGRRLQPRLVRLAVVRPLRAFRGQPGHARPPTRRTAAGSRSAHRRRTSRRPARRPPRAGTIPTTRAGPGSTRSPR